MTSVLRQLPLRFRRTFLPLLTVVAMLGSTLGVTAAFAGTSPYNATNGELDDPTFFNADDICGSGADDQIDSTGGKQWQTIHTYDAPVILTGTLGGGKYDICDFWMDSRPDETGDIWLYAAFTRATNTGSTELYLELLNSAADCDIADIATCNPFENRNDGSRVIAFDWQGNDAIITPTLRLWDPVTETFGAHLELTGNAFGSTGDDGIFGEFAINLSDTVPPIIPNINDATECEIIASALPMTLPGNAPTADPKDIVLATAPPISNCGTAQIVKKDAADGNVLTGAHYTIYRDNGSTAGELDAGDTEIGTCVTGSATEPCVFNDLLGGNYLAEETAAPEWYVELSGAAAVKPFTVTIGETTTITFVNPPIPIRIDVTPETDTNPVGHAHRFTVTIEKDPQADGNWVPAEFDYAADPSDPQPGEFLLNWSGVTATVDLDPAGAANPCIDGTDSSGECVVDVTATTTGNGTLTATLFTPYQHSTTPNPIPTVSVSSGSVYDRIADSGAKFWRGWRVDIDDPATNLLGDEHVFTVTVTEYGPDPQDPQQTSEEPASDVVVVVTWDGPTGSTVTGDGTAVPALPAGVNPGALPTAACTTDTAGECDITVDSDTNVGTGTLTVVYLSGAINGEATTMSTFSQQDDVDTTKTWIEYRLWVTPDQDINQVGWEHDFDVHVQMDDGTGWVDVEGATFTPPSTLTASDGDWSFDDDLGDDLTLVDDTCDDGTDSDGVCTITVESPSIGTVVLTVTGVTVPFDGGTTHLSLSDTALSAGFEDYTNESEKTWIDYGVTIGDDGTNLLGEPHPFTVAVTRSDIGALEGATVYLTWDGPAGSVIYPAGQPGSPYADTDAGTDGVQFTCTTDAAGACDVEVNSTSAVGTGTLSVTKVEDNSGDVSDGGSVTFELGEKDTTKTWIAVDLDIDDSATNLTGEDHVFTVTATLFDGDPMGGEDLPVTGATLCISVDGSVGSVVGATAGDGDPCAVGEYEISSTTDGEFEITVTSDDPGSLTVTLESVHFSYDGDDFSVDLTEGSDGYTPDAESSVEATKTWIAVDLDISGDSTNLVGVDHTFDVTALVFDGDPEAGEDLPVTGATLCISVTGTVGSVVGATAGDGDPCEVGQYEITSTTDGEFEIVVDSDDAGSLTVTLESVHFSWNGTSFSVDLTSGSDGYQPADGSDTEATKTWISYALAITPQDATNLLPSDPDHLLTVTLSSEGGAPIEGQTLDLTLTSDNGALITAVDADGDGILDDLEPPATGAECVTDALGQCDVVISATTPGSATLSASFTFTTDDGEHTIESSEFPSTLPGDENGQDADKTWTTYVVTVNGPAINLLGSPHTFTVHVQQTFDGENFVDIEGAVFGTSDEDGSYITISDISASGDVASITGGTCFTGGTDADGECTVIVESTATTIATVTAYYEGTASDSQSALFYDENTKQWIDYRLDVTPDTADNLVDTDHVFTVAVEVDLGDGEGWQAVPDGSEVALALTGVGTIISAGDGGTIDADGKGGTCVTDGGTCEVVIRSAVAGQSSLTATYTGIATNGELVNVEESADFTNADSPAIKNWVDYELVMDEDAVNPIGTTHTFTATLTVDTGDGFGPAAGEEVDFTISGVGTVVEVENGTVDADERGGTCETDADGTCYIIIASNEVGATTVTATYGAVVGETSRDFSDSAVKTWVSNPAIDLVKDVDKTTAGIGELVTYTYTITNTGDVTLTNVQLIDEVTITGAFDQLLELIGAAGAITLEPGESTTLTSTHLVTEADLPGPIDNVATVTGEAPDGTEVSDTDDETVDPFGLPAISLTKSAALPGDDDAIKSVGVDPDNPAATVIRYDFVIVNEGNVTLTDVRLQDFVLSELPSGTGTLTFGNATTTVDGDLLSVTIADTTLSPGESTTGTLLFAVRSGDVDLGLITNVAQVTGTAPDNTTVTDEDVENVALVLPDVVPPPPAPTPVLPKTGAEFTDILLWALLTAGLGFALLLIRPPGRLAPRRRED
jgi:hypothetical protein